jgi:hypothetical protein
MGRAKPGGVLAGRYRFQTVLGRGGMGVVWLATDEVLHRDVAVKEVCWPAKLGAADREFLRQRAVREARAAARLNHPNIVRVYDVLEDGGRPWIVMQLVSYRSLTEIVRDDGPLSSRRAARVGLEILAAIQAAHAAGVVHRDVKPGNVLLGPEDQVVLTGFGTAVADGSPTLSAPGMVAGAVSYLAPERAAGLPATPAADLWSLGATLYAAVEGRPPFDRDGTMAVLTAVTGEDPDPPIRAGPLWPVIRRLLRKDPHARLGAAQAEHLLRLVAGVPATKRAAAGDESTARLGRAAPAPDSHIVTGHDGAPARGTVPAQRRRQAAAAESTGAEPALIPGLEPLTHVAARESLQPQPPPPAVFPRSRHRRLQWVLAAIGCLAAVAAVAAALSLVSARAPGHRASAPAVPKASHAGPASHPSTGTTVSPSHKPARPGRRSGPGVLPAGFTRYRDPTGFSIGVPQGWQVSHEGHLVRVRDPASGRFLIIDQTTHPKPDPLADWRQQEAARISTYPGYHRIRLQAVHYPQAERTADWEFTYYQNGQLIHVLNRNVLASAHHAYALYWSTPARQWDTSFHLFRAFAATFHPAGPSPES